MSRIERRRLFFIALDPLHVGSGERSLGRVDLPIVRDPATQVPKVPGTSLAGLARSNAALLYGKPGCAGQGSTETVNERGHCGQPSCPICYTFGSLRTSRQGDDAASTSYAGVVRLHDAHLLFYPVPTSLGPVWVTTPDRLSDAGFCVLEAPGKEDAVVTFDVPAAGIDLGWLLLPVKKRVAGQSVNSSLQGWNSLRERIAVVDESLYGPIVNANLEVRTSVAIDPLTGAAAHGALFTYEAIARLSWLYADVVLDPYRKVAFRKVEKAASNGKDNAGEALAEPWNDPLDVVRSGLRLAEWLGIGGMGTRGFGRIRLAGEVVL